MKYYEVFGSGGYHSAFMTTYAFSAQAFEDVPLPRLRATGCRNIAVLADKSMLNMSITEFGPPRYAGSLYHVMKIAVPGAFHPKLTLLVGADKGRLLVGSANLTALGLGGNRELIADLNYSHEAADLAPLLGQALTYIRSHVPKGDPWFSTALDRALRNAPWLRQAIGYTPDEGHVALSLLYDRPDATILDQVVAAIDGDRIERLVILSPYWDDKLEGLKRLRAAVGMPPTDILLEASSSSFPAARLSEESGIRFFDIEHKATGRFTHAKLILALGQQWDHVISGSMNCSLPALFGHATHRGNAEAGVYKRVNRGEALVALELETYGELALAPNQLSALPTSEHLGASELGIVDGGSFELEGELLSWKPSHSSGRRATAIHLFDRDGTELEAIDEITDENIRRWALQLEEGRPRLAQVEFADGSRSCLTPITDLDLLAHSTMPPRLGRRRQIADMLDEMQSEELYLLEAITELETLDLEEENNRTAGPLARTGQRKSEDIPLSQGILPYEAFVEARNRARKEQHPTPPFLRAGHENAASLLSACLNRLVGLVSSDLSAKEEQDFQSVGNVDLRTTEPSTPSDQDEQHLQDTELVASPSAKAKIRATGKKFLDAVAAFENRTRALRGKRISTAELVRLRALLQVVLAYAQPVSGISKPHQVLPLGGKEGFDWPRLLGRLLKQHFGTIRSLQSLNVEPAEGEHQRVIEYMAVAHYAAQAAVLGAGTDPTSAPLRGPLKALSDDLEAQVSAIVSGDEKALELFDSLTKKLEERFDFIVRG